MTNIPQNASRGGRTHQIFLASLILALALLPGQAEDWPQWMGPNRDGVWNESGIVKKFPETGLPVLWRHPVGLGYAGPSVASGKVFVMDYQKRSGTVKNHPSGRSMLEGRERVLCLDARSGQELWVHAYDQVYNISYPGGPRCTPSVSGDKVYTLGAEGMLHCLDASNGSIIWHINLKQTYKVRTQIWGHAAHPLVDENHVYCLVGGQGSAVVAFDKNTGREKWKSLSASDPGYCPPVLIEHEGRTQLIVWTPESLNGLDPATGDLLWSLPLKPAYDLPSSMPRHFGRHLYVSAIGNVAALIQLGSNDAEPSIVWRGQPNQAVYCSNSTPLVQDDVIYGCDIESSALIAARVKDGSRLWQTTRPTLGPDFDGRARHGTAFLVRHRDHSFIFSETGDLILARLTPDKYEEISRQSLLKPTNEAFGRPVVWSHPAFAEKSVFARNDEEIIRVNLEE